MKGALLDTGGADQRLPDAAGEVVSQCEVCQAFEKAPNFPAAGASPASPFNEKIQVGLLFVDAAIALRAMDSRSEYSLSVKACSENPLDMRDALADSRIASVGRPRAIQLDAG